MKVEWPARCGECGNPIEDWGEAGLYETRWVHKACFSRASNEASNRGVTLPDLRSPIERSTFLELPMLVSLLFFHFGVGILVIGWIMLTQDKQTSTDDIGFVLLAIGLITPLLGVIGVALNVMSRRRIETVRQALDLQGGWKQGR